MRTPAFTSAIVHYLKELITKSVVKTLLTIQDGDQSFDIYRPTYKEELKQDSTTEDIADTINVLLEILITHGEVYFGRFIKKTDLEMLKDMGYQNPEKVTFCIFKNDFDNATKINKQRFAIEKHITLDQSQLN